MLFWSNDYSRGLAGHKRLDQPAPSAAGCAIFHPMDWWIRDRNTERHRLQKLCRSSEKNRSKWVLFRIAKNIVRQVTIPYFSLQFRGNFEVFRCFEIHLKSRTRTQGSVSRMRADPDIFGIVNTRHRCDSQKYLFPMWILSTAISIIDLNVDRWFTVKLM